MDESNPKQTETSKDKNGKESFFSVEDPHRRKFYKPSLNVYYNSFDPQFQVESLNNNEQSSPTREKKQHFSKYLQEYYPNLPENGGKLMQNQKGLEK